MTSAAMVAEEAVAACAASAVASDDDDVDDSRCADSQLSVRWTAKRSRVTKETEECISEGKGLCGQKESRIIVDDR